MSERTITGLAVPFGQVGETHVGLARFARGAITWGEHPVPILLDHDSTSPAGVVTSIEETDDGLYVTAEIDRGPRGDDVLARIASGSRTGMSVGVVLAESVRSQMARARRAAINASGMLREISMTATPAFDGARASVSADLDASTLTLTAELQPIRPQPRPGMLITTAPEGMTMATEAPTVATTTAPTEPPVEPPTVTASAPPPASAPAPAPPAAIVPAGATPALLTAQGVYHRGSQYSLVRDAYAAQFYGDTDARARLDEFSDSLLTAATGTTTTGAEIIPPGYRGDLLIPAIDKGRPLVSRLTNRVNLTDKTPFEVPADADFTDAATTGEGVDEHTEGQSSVAAGDFNPGNVTVTPRAVSGLYQVSRELLDASNPAIDALAVRAMLRSYRNQSETYAVARLAAAGSATALSAFGSGGTDDLIDAMFTFSDNRFEDPPFMSIGNGLFNDLAQEKLSNGEPRFPSVNPANREGTTSGLGALNIRGVLGIKTWAVADRELYLTYPDDVLWGEAQPRQFRFEERNGPGLVDLALWGYQAGHVLRSSGVARYSIAAAA